MNFKYIDSGERLFNYLESLRESRVEAVALDIEGESNLHSYGEKLCLVQVCDGKDVVIIDPFKVSVKMIKQLAEDRSIMKIMFDAAGDRAFLYKNNGIDLKSVLDLQVAVGLLEYENRDLSSVISKALGIEPARSKKKFQRYNWGSRPLRSEALEYAAGDVVHLFALKDALLADIIGRGLIEKFILRNMQVQNKPHVYSSKPKLLRDGAFRHLDRKTQAAFEKILSAREEVAKKFDLPPNLLLTKEQLLALATGSAKIRDVRFASRVPPAARDMLASGVNNALAA